MYINLYTTSGKTVLLDSEDYNILVSSFEQPMSEAQNVAKLQLSVTTNGYVVLNVGQRVTLARLILGIEDSSLIVKYLNNNKLDLRRDNLQVCTRSEHMQPIGKNNKGKPSRISKVHKVATVDAQEHNSVTTKTWAVENGCGKGGRLVYKYFSSFSEAKAYASSHS